MKFNKSGLLPLLFFISCNQQQEREVQLVQDTILLNEEQHYVNNHYIAEDLAEQGWLTDENWTRSVDSLSQGMLIPEELYWNIP